MGKSVSFAEYLPKLCIIHVLVFPESLPDPPFRPTPSNHYPAVSGSHFLAVIFQVIKITCAYGKISKQYGNSQSNH